MPRRPAPFWTLDCETDPFRPGRVPQPFIWGVYTGESYHEFETAADVAAFCREHPVTVYAHNGGKFDYHYLLNEIEPDQRIMVINQRLAKFKIGLCEFRDSVNLIPARLADFQKEQVDYAIFEPELRDLPANREIIRNYLRSDCLNLYDVIAAYFKHYGRGLTQAGAAMKFWQKQSGIKAPRQHAAKYALYKPFYYGGRVQCFAQGYQEKSFTVCDINSAYPYAMLSNHPLDIGAEMLERLPDESKWGKCLVRVRGVSKGAMPYRADDGALYFPEDERRVREYLVTGWELLAGVETDTFKIHSLDEIHYFSGTTHFKDYVRHFYELRKEAKARGDKAQDIFAKIFLNALYGKFGSNPAKYSEWIIASEGRLADWLSEGFDQCQAWPNGNFLLKRKLPEEKHRFYNIATAASITGYVRAHLWRSILKCRDPIYCDTDSIAAGDTSALDRGAALGQWKLELCGDRFAVAGKKLYAYHEAGGDETAWKTASKGVSLTADEIVRVAKGEKLTYQPSVPTYSILKSQPVFINRLVKRTHRELDS